MRAQVAFEYMAVVGLVLAMLLPIWIYISNTQQRANTELYLSYAKNAVEKITETSDLVYSQGPPAKVNVKVYIPRRISQVVIVNNTIYFKIYTEGGTSDVSATSSATMNGTIPTTEGIYTLSIEAKQGYVQITKI